ncbi:MAG: hypothetical protein GC149_14185 [Gammaproteobacteria bacterium]|nr:hypothetical protein [Gammaproteobacteria bacterium]
MDGYSNKPKILKGAFVEYGISLPPLFVVFQFNPEQLSRTKSISFQGVSSETSVDTQSQTQDGSPLTIRQNSSRTCSLRSLHERDYPDSDQLLAIRDAQQVEFQDEQISFDIRLDAGDDLDDGNALVGEVGILPQLSTLELMMYSKGDSLLGQLVSSLISKTGFSFTDVDKPPMVLFIWGYSRVLPVNINSMRITESEFNTILSPTRATISVELTVIEGKNIPYTYSKALKEVMSVLNLANITDLAKVVVPG